MGMGAPGLHGRELFRLDPRCCAGGKHRIGPEGMVERR